jgi:hypothetical protein
MSPQLCFLTVNNGLELVSHGLLFFAFVRYDKNLHLHFGDVCSLLLHKVHIHSIQLSE